MIAPRSRRLFLSALAVAGAIAVSWLGVRALTPLLPQTSGVQIPANVLAPDAFAVVDFADLAAQDDSRRRTLQQLGVVPSGIAPLDGTHAEPQVPWLTPLAKGPRDAAPAGPSSPSPSPTRSFQGLDDISDGTSLYIPPDTTGAVGPARIFNTLNNNYRIINKSTGATVSTVSQNSFWQSVNPANGVFDPRALYDPYQNRFIVVAVAGGGATSSSLLVGVSNSSDPGGTWTLARYPMGTTNCTGAIGCWADYPTLGFNQNWIAVGLNMFRISNNAFVESRVTAFNYSTFLSGSAPAVDYFVTNDFAIVPSITYSNSETTLYAPTHVSSAGAAYRLNTITGTAGSPVYTQGPVKGHTLLSGWIQPSGDTLPQASEPGTGLVHGVDAGDARIISAVFRNNAVWYSQTIGLPAGGAATHTAAQWVRIDTAGNDVDAGRIEDSSATATNGGKWYAYPSLAVNAGNDVLVGFSQFSSTQFPSAGYAVRAGGDAAGTTRDPAIAKSGIGFYYKRYGGAANRWGDFSNTQVDPSDDSSFWSVQEYSKAQVGTGDGSGFWSTWWVQVASPTTDVALTISKTGSGTGTVTSNPAGINCGATCSATFTSDQVVTLTATPAAGSIFDGWTGDADCSDGNVTMSAARNCTATFTQTFTLTVNKTGSGGGTITSTPAGINCGSTCSAAFVSGQSVALTATPAAGSIFDGWTGDADCTDGSVTMSAARSCTATFTQTFTLSLSKTGSGGGTITSTPSGINCGSTCSAAFSSGQSVALTATPAAGSIFGGWTGDADCTDGNVTMSAARNCTATFTQTFTLTVSKTGSGGGTVTTTPSGIDCGATCSASFVSGQAVALSATPAFGSIFDGWSGDADCVDGSVTMIAARSCSAQFHVGPPMAFGKTNPSNGALAQRTNLALRWQASNIATSYQYCYGRSTSCDSGWIPVGSATSAVLSGLDPATTYFWQVQAVNVTGTTDANAGAWWSFTTDVKATLTPVPGDFDGDRKTDVTVFRPGNGAWYILQSRSDFSTAAAFNWGGSADVPTPGDFDGDRLTDVAIYRPANGVWYLLQSSTNFASAAAFTWGISTDLPAAGDYDGDGRTDIAVYRPDNGTFYILQSSTNFGSAISFVWGAAGDVPVPADYDGDGQSDVAVYRPSDGTWRILQSSTDFTIGVTRGWGAAADLPVPGDYDGDGRTDLAVYRPDNGTWYILLSSTNFTAAITFVWGAAGDTPVAGDFDGDGKTDVAVYRPSNGTWYILKSSTNFTSALAYQWGLTGDVPILRRQ